jgi:hypothetical protein
MNECNALVKWQTRENPFSLGKNLSNVAWFTTNPTRTSLKSNPCLRNHRPANNHLNYEGHIDLWIPGYSINKAQLRYCMTYQSSRRTNVKVLWTIPIEGHKWSILQDVPMWNCERYICMSVHCAVLYNHLNKEAIYTLINMRQNARGKEMKNGRSLYVT